MSNTLLERFRSFMGRSENYTGNMGSLFPKAENFEQFLSQELSSLFEEVEKDVIGDDDNEVLEPSFFNPSYQKNFVNHERNQLRADQRAKLQEIKERWL